MRGRISRRTLEQAHPEFSLFLVLVGSYPIEFLILFTLQRVHSYEVWSRSVSLLMGSIFLLELAVLYQLANILIFSHASLARHLKSLRRWTLVMLALCTTTLAAMGTDISTDGGTSALARLSLAQDFLDTGLLIILVIVSRTLAIPWRAIPAGVAFGWGISSLFNLVADALVRTVTRSSILWGDVIRAGGFNACALIWLW